MGWWGKRPKGYDILLMVYILKTLAKFKTSIRQININIGLRLNTDITNTCKEFMS